ncbi:hypothetical protein CDL12_04067 [Handroanthus impetiginosus]|uniref:AP2/ERF domain-containing protein n=1 Tax=Handroanthus impetiginosus TaxID=429701 RepID=A0A2G9I0A4_9LAMI|nr:hypothetical protein CDL12_04067 [Handroanthus impetiginosus]
MASMNNWLGFSLSPHELPPQPHQRNHSQGNSVFNSDEISAVQVSGPCFDLTSASPNIPSLNLPAPFGILEAFNRNSTLSQHDWNHVKDVGMTSFSCSSHNMENQERPKLENFLGVAGHAVADHQLNGNDNSYNNLYQETEVTSHTNTSGGDINGSNSTIGLSMIKNWLRNNPAPSHTAENKVGNEAVPPQGSQTLSLSMSTGSQSNVCASDNGKAVDSTQTGADSVPRKSIDTFGQRTSIYRGVTRHRWTGRYEAHLWDNSCRREGQTRKGRQDYCILFVLKNVLGGYDNEEKAARAYDLAALKYWGTTTTTNFPISNYEKEIEEMKHMTRQEYVASLRRKSSGFSRGASIYRGVTRHHQHGRWQARIGRVAGNKDLYLGTFSNHLLNYSLISFLSYVFPLKLFLIFKSISKQGTQEEAAEAYDIAAIKFRGLNAVTNFEISRYDVKSILESSTLPIGGAAKRLKDAENAETARANEGNLNLHLIDGHINNGYGIGTTNHGWFQQAQPLSMYPYAHQRFWCKQEQDSDIGFNDIHQLGNTQNFLQPSVLHNLMSLDSCSSGSNSHVIYGNNGSGDGPNGGSFGVPMIETVIVQDGNQNHANGYLGNDEGIFGSTDAYQQARNLYYQSHQSSLSNGIAKAGVYSDPGSTNNWIPTAVPTLAARTNGVVWNDT